MRIMYFQTGKRGVVHYGKFAAVSHAVLLDRSPPSPLLSPPPPDPTPLPPASLDLQERQRRVSELKERSALLESSGRSAQDEAETVREQLARAMEDLKAAKESSGELEARLGPLEKERQDAHTAQERLRWGGKVWYRLRLLTAEPKSLLILVLSAGILAHDRASVCCWIVLLRSSRCSSVVWFRATRYILCRVKRYQRWLSW